MPNYPKKSIYLAGPITGLSYDEARLGWRKEFAALVPAHINCFSPMRGKDFLQDLSAIPGAPTHNGDKMDHNQIKHAMASDSGIIGRDYNDVKSCDAIVANFLGAKRVSIGTCVEFGFAHALQKPVIMICERDHEINPHWHLFLTGIATYHVTSLQEASFLATFLLTPGV